MLNDKRVRINLILGVLLTCGTLVLLHLSGAGFRPMLLATALGLGWLAIAVATLGGVFGRASRQWCGIDAQVAELSARTSQFHDYLAEEFNGQFEQILSENRQVQDILADAVDRLITSFTTLEEQSRQQQTLALNLTGRGQGGHTPQETSLDFESLRRDIERVLTTFVEASRSNSRAARELVAQMGQTSSQFQTVLGMLGEVKKIAAQTNLLAINATIEAARAGQAGRGFAVVAEEVRLLSVHSNKFSEQIGEQVHGISTALQSVEATIHKMADQESQLVATASSRVGELMEKTQAFNRHVEDSAEKIGQLSEYVETGVRTAVTSLQFQDMSTQVIGHVNTRLELLGSILSGMAELPLAVEGAGAGVKETCECRLQQFNQTLTAASELVEKAHHSPVSQKSLETGEIELF
jgi:methyl-accepting chemotaxis protein